MTLFGHVLSITLWIAESTFLDRFCDIFSTFLISCHFVNEIPVLLIASPMSIPFLMSFPASVIVVGISRALGSFFTCHAIFQIVFTHPCTAINSATSFAVGSLHSWVT